MTEEYRAVPADDGSAEIVRLFFEQNLAQLHSASVPLSEWRETLGAADPDEMNMLIVAKDGPVGWFRINGICGGEGELWLSMLVIGEGHKRKGAGKFAVRYFEDFAEKSGYSRLCIHTTADNAPALSLYKSFGFTVSATDIKDGIPHCTLIKNLR